ncbi:hypothetical protein LINPERHAP1_LOCUS35934 [Linum perenne]
MSGWDQALATKTEDQSYKYSSTSTTQEDTLLPSGPTVRGTHTTKGQAIESSSSIGPDRTISGIWESKILITISLMVAKVLANRFSQLGAPLLIDIMRLPMVCKKWHPPLEWRMKCNGA